MTCNIFLCSMRARKEYLKCTQTMENKLYSLLKSKTGKNSS